MAKRPKDFELDVNRLLVAAARARKVLMRFREERREMIRQTTGNHYSDDGARERVPINLLALYRRILGPSLIAQNPRVMLSTLDSAMTAPVDVMQSWTNAQIKRIKFEKTGRRLVTDAFYGVAIAHVGLCEPAESALYSWGHRAGEPLISTISIDDWVFDTQALDLDEVSFIGHRIRVPLDAVKDSRYYGKGRKKLEPSPQERYNTEGDERARQIGQGLWWNQEDFEDMIDLWKFFLPRHQIVVTIPGELMLGPTLGQDEHGDAEPLAVQRWIGPHVGPYHILGFDPVPDNPIAKGPIQDLFDLHMDINANYRKLDRQARRQKDLYFFTGNDADQQRINRASDGDAVRVDRPDMLKFQPGAGPSQPNQLFYQEQLQRFSWVAGNLDIMGGLSAQARTLGQDRMLDQNSSHLVTDMGSQTINYFASIFEAYSWFWWKHPYKVMEDNYSPEGMPEIKVPRQLHPADDRLLGRAMTRHGPFEALDLRVDPYSLQHKTPQQRIQEMDQMMQQILIPLMPLLAQQGKVLDIDFYLRERGKLMDAPWLQQLISIGPLQSPDEQAGMETGGMPAQTERRYVRENRSERTNQGTTQNMLHQLAGVNPGGSRNGNGVSR